MVLSLCWEALGAFYSSNRLGNLIHLSELFFFIHFFKNGPEYLIKGDYPDVYFFDEIPTAKFGFKNFFPLLRYSFVILFFQYYLSYGFRFHYSTVLFLLFFSFPTFIISITHVSKPNHYDYYITPWEFFPPELADGFLREFVGQQVPNSLLDTSQYSGRSQQCCSLDGPVRPPIFYSCISLQNLWESFQLP